MSTLCQQFSRMPSGGNVAAGGGRYESLSILNHAPRTEALLVGGGSLSAQG
jgi:hypothetical protein